MKQAHLIKQAAILYCSQPKYWTNTRLANRFGVSVPTILKWQDSKHWAEIENGFLHAKEMITEGEENLFKEDYLDRLSRWQGLQEKFATSQMSLAIKLTAYSMELLEEIKKTEPLTIDTLKQVGNFGNLSVASCRLQESASNSMNIVLAIDTILDNIETEPKQLELDLVA